MTAESLAEPAGLASAESGGLASREWRAPYLIDVARTLAVHRHGPADPSFAVDQAGAVWRASLTPEGPGTIRVTAAGAPAVASAGPGTVVTGSAWGPGAGWLLSQLPAMLGADDRPEDFTPGHPLLRELARRYHGTRVGRSGRVLEALIPAILEQKVVSQEAHRAWRLLLATYGHPAPGPAPAGMRVPPSAREWARVPSWAWHRAGVEAVRFRTIAGAAAAGRRLEEITGLPAAAADRRLRSLPGIGPWTSAEVRQRACGDPDAVTVGDYHLPAMVGWTLAGRVVDDDGMLELLAPYAGHRYRATRLIELGGRRPPRRGPRLAIRDYRAF